MHNFEQEHVALKFSDVNYQQAKSTIAFGNKKRTTLWDLSNRKKE